MYRIVTHDDAIGRWVYERSGGGDWVIGAGATIGVYRGNDIVAGTTFTQWAGPNIFTAVAVEDRRAISRKFLFLCFWYPFEQLQCRRITALVNSDNSACLQSIEHLGFKREATLVDAAPNGDVIVFRMFKRECAWLQTLRIRELRGSNPSSLRQSRLRA